jgi:hypothetical protein
MIPKYRKKMEKTNITLSLRKRKEIYLVAFNRLVKSNTHHIIACKGLFSGAGELPKNPVAFTRGKTEHVRDI